MVTILLTSQAVVEASYATFTCVVQTNSLADLSIIWKFNNVTIEMTSLTYTMEKQDLNASTAESILTISNVTILNAGVYSCVAENLAGSDVADGVLSVIGKLFIYTAYIYTYVVNSKLGVMYYNTFQVTK